MVLTDALEALEAHDASRLDHAVKARQQAEEQRRREAKATRDRPRKGKQQGEEAQDGKLAVLQLLMQLLMHRDASRT